MRASDRTQKGSVRSPFPLRTAFLPPRHQPRAQRTLDTLTLHCVCGDGAPYAAWRTVRRRMLHVLHYVFRMPLLYFEIEGFARENSNFALSLSVFFSSLFSLSLSLSPFPYPLLSLRQRATVNRAAQSIALLSTWRRRTSSFPLLRSFLSVPCLCLRLFLSSLGCTFSLSAHLQRT